MEREFLNLVYNMRRSVSMMELTNTRQWKDEPVVDYINRWLSRSLDCKERLSEISAVEMCMQGMHWDLVYILQGNRPASFEELKMQAHDIEISITNHGSNMHALSNSRKEKRERKKIRLLNGDRACQNAFDSIKKYLLSPLVLGAPTPQKPLILYIAGQKESPGAMLTQDDQDKKEISLYYLSHRLTKTALKYNPVEKTCLALTTIKGQALADFLANHRIPADWEISKDFFIKEVFFVETFQPLMMFIDGAAHVELEHVPIEENCMADALAKLATTLALRGKDKVDIPICQQWVLLELVDCGIKETDAISILVIEV
ncbi:hypothetical protein RJ639_035412 [Escallonia herrerae]|uniref:Reverse transcriptase/retrotransposon-derived protein RNase H-like domain-containing protein n=1 Tax=Escallonia herrerae TaxID=1293975 RepID=A0AA89BIB4_9ASTE|nr:hypothetical protein RJ639_035412 [Escallonia herrerae]